MKNTFHVLVTLSAAFVSLALCGCSTQYLSMYREEISFADYRPYTEMGFTISPTSSAFTYQSIGELTMVFTPGIVESPAPKANDDEDRFKAKWQQEKEQGEASVYTPEVEEMIDKIVKQAQQLGADALLNFKIESRPAFVKASVSGMSANLPSSEYVVSGLAVKLK